MLSVLLASFPPPFLPYVTEYNSALKFQINNRRQEMGSWETSSKLLSFLKIEVIFPLEALTLIIYLEMEFNMESSISSTVNRKAV